MSKEVQELESKHLEMELDMNTAVMKSDGLNEVIVDARMKNDQLIIQIQGIEKERIQLASQVQKLSEELLDSNNKYEIANTKFEELMNNTASKKESLEDLL